MVINNYFAMAYIFFTIVYNYFTMAYTFFTVVYTKLLLFISQP